jgi:hypothetical protein
MIKFDKFYLSEAMSRRDFLRFGGRAVAASMAPKSVVSNVVKNVLTGTPAQVFTPMAASKAARNLIKAGYAIGNTSLTQLRPENTIKYASFLKTNLAFLANALQSKNLGLFGWEKDDTKAGQNFTKNALSELNQIISGQKTFNSFDDSSSLEYIAQGDIIDVMGPMYRAGLVTKDLEQDMVKQWGVDLIAGEKFRGLTGKNFFGSDEVDREFQEFKKKYFKKEMEKGEYRKTAYSVGYSRMDKAGGSEDEGYAKYYESFLSEMNRRDFLRTVGKAATVATADPKTIGGMLTKSVAGGGAAKLISGSLSLPTLIFNYYRDIAFDRFDDTGSSLLALINGLHKGGINLALEDPFLKKNIDLWLKVGEGQISFDKAEELGLEMGSHDIMFSLASHLMDKNLMPEEAFKLMEQEYGWKKEWFKRNKNPDIQQKDQSRDNIDYSRMDTAGGSEDEGYAKYYEKVTFNTIVNLIENQNGHFKVSALVPVGERQTVKREEGFIDAPYDTNRKRVLGAFISRYTKNVGHWVKRNEKSYVVRWVPIEPEKKETQQDFGF